MSGTRVVNQKPSRVDANIKSATSKTTHIRPWDSFSSTSTKQARSAMSRACKKSNNDTTSEKNPDAIPLQIKDRNVKNIEPTKIEEFEQPRKLRNAGKSLRLNLTTSKTEKENLCDINNRTNKNSNILKKLKGRNTTFSECNIPVSSHCNIKTNKRKKSDVAIPSRFRFPKWFSNSVASVKRGKKRSCDADVYDLNQDEDLMMEIQAVKKADIKKAKVVKTKKVVNSKKVQIVNFNTTAYKQNTVVKKSKSLKTDISNKEKSIVSQYCSPKVIVTTENSNPEAVKPFGYVRLEEDKNLELLPEVNYKCYLLSTSNQRAEENRMQLDKNIVHSDLKQSTQPINTGYNVIDLEIAKKSNLVNSIESDQGKLSEVYVTPEKQRKKCKMDELFDNLERSFLMPKMTSTPEEKEAPPTNKLNSGEVFAARVLDIPPIAHQGKQGDYFDLELESPQKKLTNHAEITLFESPVKESVKDDEYFSASDKSSHTKPLFDSPDEVLSINHQKSDTSVEVPKNSPFQKQTAFCEIDYSKNNKQFNKNISSSEGLDCSPAKLNPHVQVLKPRKSYQSPHEFRRHIAKAKRDNNQKTKKQTKEDKYIESLNNHFSELEDTILCVE